MLPPASPPVMKVMMVTTSAVAVMAAALGVFGAGSGWPDLAVASVMGVLALTAARSVIQQARAELRPVPAHA